MPLWFLSVYVTLVNYRSGGGRYPSTALHLNTTSGKNSRHFWEIRMHVQRRNRGKKGKYTSPDAITRTGRRNTNKIELMERFPWWNIFPLSDVYLMMKPSPGFRAKNSIIKSARGTGAAAVGNLHPTTFNCSWHKKCVPYIHKIWLERREISSFQQANCTVKHSQRSMTGYISYFLKNQ